MRYVAYYRVSTKQQGRSGLGLEVQKMEVARYLQSNDELLQEFTEVDSGKNDTRKELAKAIEYCKEYNAKLLIAQLDRLSRNVSFIFKLRDSQIDFVCCDLPDANTLTIGIFATMAQHERELTSKRIKAALAIRKMQGKKLGTPANLTATGRAKGRAKNAQKAATNTNNIQAMELISLYKDKGMSLSQIAAKLNANGFKTARGMQFQKTTVTRLYKRYLTTSS